MSESIGEQMEKAFRDRGSDSDPLPSRIRNRRILAAIVPYLSAIAAEGKRPARINREFGLSAWTADRTMGSLRHLRSVAPYPRTHRLWESEGSLFDRVTRDRESVLEKLRFVERLLAWDWDLDLATDEASELFLGLDLPMPDELVEALKTLEVSTVGVLRRLAIAELVDRGLSPEDAELVGHYADLYAIAMTPKAVYQRLRRFGGAALSTITIEQLDLMPRTEKALREAGLMTLDKIVILTEQQLLRLLGRKSLNEVVSALESHGLSPRALPPKVPSREERLRGIRLRKRG